MRNNRFRKGLVLGIVVLFVGTSMIPCIGIGVSKKSDILLPLETGLVAHWDFDEGNGNILHDVSGNGNDGIIYGANWASGFTGNALKFDGIDDYVLVPSSVVFQLHSWTICGWINVTNFTSSGAGIIGKNQDSLGKYNFYIQISQNNSLLSTYETCSSEEGHYVFSDTFDEGEYLFFTSTRNDSSGEHIIYINGEQNDSGIWLDIPCANGEDLFFGKKFSGDSFFNGTIDEVQIYNRPLSEVEIQYLYNNPGIGDFVYVDDDYDSSTPGWQIDHFDNIQDGIDAVNENGIVYVYDGTYYENVVIDKSINLIGEDRDNTIIDASGSGDVVTISAECVNISRFTLQNSGGSSSNVGLRIESDYNTISDNNISSNNMDGIWLYESNDNTLSNNSICSNYDDALVLYESNNNTISGNLISLNDDNGIIIYSPSTNNTILGNTISSNNDDGVYIDGSGNKIYHNNFIDNYQNAYDISDNTWDDGYPSGGNYWSDYNGIDDNGDGIGDTPYPITGGISEDLYPLMHPFGPPYAEFTYDFETSVFNASTSGDYNGEIVSYEWDFGDGTKGEGEIIYHKYCEAETYDVTLTVTDDDGLTGNITECVDVLIANIPPEVEIFGPNSGKPGAEIEYVFIVNDTDGDEIFLSVDWGDGCYHDWHGPFWDGTTIYTKHTWNQTGTYEIKAKVKDFCAESEWVTLEVTIPRNRMSINSLFLRLLERFIDVFPIMRYLFRFIGIY